MFRFILLSDDNKSLILPFVTTSILGMYFVIQTYNVLLSLLDSVLSRSYTFKNEREGTNTQKTTTFTIVQVKR